LPVKCRARAAAVSGRRGSTSLPAILRIAAAMVTVGASPRWKLAGVKLRKARPDRKPVPAARR